MTTKKKRREIVAARTEAFLAEERERGLIAQKQDRERRERKAQDSANKIASIEHRKKVKAMEDAILADAEKKEAENTPAKEQQ